MAHAPSLTGDLAVWTILSREMSLSRSHSLTTTQGPGYSLTSGRKMASLGGSARGVVLLDIFSRGPEN